MPKLPPPQRHKSNPKGTGRMSFLKITLYAVAMTLCAISAGVSTAAYVMASTAAVPMAAKPLPKPTPNCPDCQDATAPLASVKE